MRLPVHVRHQPPRPAVGEGDDRCGHEHGQREPPVEGEGGEDDDGRGDEGVAQRAQQVRRGVHHLHHALARQLAEFTGAFAAEPAERQPGDLVADAVVEGASEVGAEAVAAHGRGERGGPVGGGGHGEGGGPGPGVGRVVAEEAGEERDEQGVGHALEDGGEHRPGGDAAQSLGLLPAQYADQQRGHRASPFCSAHMRA